MGSEASWFVYSVGALIFRAAGFAGGTGVDSGQGAFVVGLVDLATHKFATMHFTHNSDSAGTAKEIQDRLAVIAARCN